MLMRHGVEVEVECSQDARADVDKRQIAAFVCDAQTGEAESGRGDAAQSATVHDAGRGLVEGAVEDLA